MLASARAFAEVAEPVSYWYEVEVGEDSMAIVWNDVFDVRLSSYEFAFPGGLEVVSVYDGNLEVKNYEKSDGKNGGIKFSPPSQEQTHIRITMKKEGVENEYGRLRIGALCLAGRNRTNATFYFSGVNFLSAEPRDYEEKAGLVFFPEFGCVRMAWLGRDERGGYATGKIGRFFVIDKDGELGDAAGKADGLYGIVENMTGIAEPFEKWAVVAVPGSEFPQRTDASGLYSGNAVVYLIEEKINLKTPSVAVHELTHGFNSKVLAWNSATASWFDEGTSQYAAHLANIALWSGSKAGEREVFFDDIFQEEAPGVSFESLYAYYGADKDYMESWDPADPGRAEFGYAYSELVIRAYVKKYGGDALGGTYDCLAEVNETANTWQERNGIVLGCMSKAAGGAEQESILYPGKEFSGDIEKFREFVSGVAWSQTSPFKVHRYMTEAITQYEYALKELGPSNTLERAREEYNSGVEYYRNGEYDAAMVHIRQASDLIGKAYEEGGAGTCVLPQMTILAVVCMLFIARKAEK